MRLRDRLRTSGAVRGFGAPPTRRTFLAMLGSAGAVRLVPQPHGLVPSGAEARPTLLCVGALTGGGSGAIHTLAVQGGRCEPLGSIPSEQPLALASHPARPIIYAANSVNRYRHEPRGTVEAVLVDQRTGQLERVACQPLSLSATYPRSLAVSPDGRSLLVAAFGGGAYNILPLDESGVPGAPSAILKQVGRGAHFPDQGSAHPASVVFVRQHLMGIAADFGADRLDLLSPDPNAPRKFTIVNRIACRPGSGPCALALHREGGLLVAAQRLRPALTIFRLVPPAHLEQSGEIPLPSTPAAITWCPQQEILYTVLTERSCLSHLHVWQLDPAAGTLRRIAEAALPAADIRAIHAGPAALYLASERGLITVNLDHTSRTPLLTTGLSAAVRGAVSLAAVTRA